jgi:hypothetical protein
MSEGVRALRLLAQVGRRAAPFREGASIRCQAQFWNSPRESYESACRTPCAQLHNGW